MSFRLRTLAGLCLIASLFAMTTAHAQTTFYVDASVAGPGTGAIGDPFPTIGAGLAVAVAGDTIEIAAGTYPESIVLNQQITLHGAQAGNKANTRSSSPAPATETVITGAGSPQIQLQSGSAGSVIDGLALLGGGVVAQGIASSSGPITQLEIRNNIMSGHASSAVFLNDNGEDITVHGNVFIGSATSSTLFHLDQDDFDGLHFTCNEVLRTGGMQNSIGLFVDGNHNVGVSTLSSRTPLIDQNLFDGHGNGANLGTRAFDGGDITENVFSNNNSGLGFGIQNTTIARNTFSNNLTRGLRLGDFSSGQADRGAQNTTVRNNEFFGNGTADLRLQSGQAAGTIETNTVFNNSFASVTAVENNDTSGAVIDCSSNWWGDGTGPTRAAFPGTGGAILGAGSNALDFTPWFDAGTDTEVGTAGFQGDFSVLNVDDDSPQFDTVAPTGRGRIEEAVDLVSGSTVNVAAGDYDEGITLVDESVTVQGPDVTPPVVNIKASEDTGSGGDARGWYLVTVDDVAFRNLSFDGDSASGRKISQGVRFKENNETVENCDFANIRFSQYVGIAVVGFKNTTVTGGVFANIERIGVIFFGAAVTAGNVSGLDYTGKGLGDHLDYAVELGGGAVATISGVTVTGNNGTAVSDGSKSAGMLMSTFFGAGTMGTLTGNSITGNTCGIVVGFDSVDSSTVICGGPMVGDGNDLSGNSLFGFQIGGNLASAVLENNDLTGCGDAGLSVSDGSTVDAGDCGASNFTGLGSSSGGNDFSGYTFDNATPFAIRNHNSSAAPDVLAQGDSFGPSVNDDVDDVIFDQVDDAGLSRVLYSSLSLVVTCPMSLQFQCIGDAPAAATNLTEFLAQGGFVSANVGVTVSHTDTVVGAPSSTLGNHRIDRVYEIGACGTSTMCTQTINLVDTVFPMIVCNPLVVETDSGGVATITAGQLQTLTMGSSDNCTVAANLMRSVFLPINFSDPGIHDVAVSITDEAGNLSTDLCSVTVEDNISPVFTFCPGNVVVMAPLGDCETTATWTLPTATDNSGLPPNITVFPVGTMPGNTFQAGMTTITYTADDGFGNMDTCVFTVEVLVDPPTITLQPMSQTACENVPGGVTFSVAAAEPTALFQWRFNGAPILGATSSSLNVDPVTVASDGGYDCVVSFGSPACASSTSSTATLTVETVPVITQQPVGGDFCEGDPLLLTVAATGGSLLYQWRLNGVDLVDSIVISGVTTDMLSIDPLALTDSGNYDVVVSNPCADTFSAVVEVDVHTTAGDFPDVAIPIVSGINVGDTFCLTPQAELVATCTPSSVGSQDQWFSFTPTCSGTALLSTDPANGGSAELGLDTNISVFEGPPLGTPFGPGSAVDYTLVECNDASTTGAPSFLPLESTLTFAYSPGVVYYVRVSGFDGTESGRYELAFAPSNGLTLIIDFDPTPGTLKIQNLCGNPGDVYFTAITFNALNEGPGFGTGFLFGLHLSILELQDLLMLNGPPIMGTLDGSGESLFSFEPITSLGLTLYGVTATFNPSSFLLTESSQVVASDVFNF